jgi:RHS repeat-associated protein
LTGRRHYDPNVDRWLSEDHAGYEADADLHRYAANPPQ